VYDGEAFESSETRMLFTLAEIDDLLVCPASRCLVIKAYHPTVLGLLLAVLDLFSPHLS